MEILIIDEKEINHVLAFNPLFKKVIVDQCKWRMSDTKITVTLKKLVDENWSDAKWRHSSLK